MSITPASLGSAAPSVSIVVPVRNEADNVGPLIAEIFRALENRFAFEVIFVNDGSTDGTDAKLRAEWRSGIHSKQLSAPTPPRRQPRAQTTKLASNPGN